MYAGPWELLILLGMIVIVGLFALGFGLWWLSTRSKSALSISDSFAPKPLGEISTEPDGPIGFGYKTTWLAIRSTDADGVLKHLPIRNAQRGNWNSGIDAAFKGHTFVSPPVDGWVLVVSHEFPELGHPPHADQWRSLMTSLSRRFDDVQYFGTHRVSSFDAWSRYRTGIEQRAFASADSEILVNRGPKTDAERELGYEYFDGESDDADVDGYWDRDDLCFPDEEHVMEIASKWSLNPCTLDELDLPVGTGWIGILSPLQTDAA